MNYQKIYDQSKPGNENIIRKPVYLGPKKQFNGTHSERALLAYKKLSDKKKKRVLDCLTNKEYESATECIKSLGINNRKFYKLMNNKTLSFL